MDYCKIFEFLMYILIVIGSAISLEFKYHTQYELEEILYALSENVTDPIQARIYSIGKSTEGRDLLVFELTAARNNSNIVPNIQLIGNIHGNEPPGREILLHFIEYLIDNYHKEELIRWLLDNSRLHILPCLNPDGFNVAEPGDCVGINGRNNAKDMDLNRNFPDFISEDDKNEEQVETTSMRNWMDNITFVLSGDIHSGAIVAIYPFHRIEKSKYGYEMQSSITPDNNILEHLASIYSINNEIMHQQSIFCDNEKFAGGITRGAAWYYFLGGMQDYSYMVHNTMSLTFEISCCKYPPENELSNLWEQNKNSLIFFCLQANKGVTALITDAETKIAISNSNITILGIDKAFRSNRDGRFWKILLPGRYYLRVRNSDILEI
ncbi:hypothetical protein WA026_022183 [Henosepilachna vigintioctopunctata]|uniref:Peptidase M14 domain-containing protein n=1 Tax=Henosepilachna vigintioctopunctata TaxID=420089 RepID=A0AAW1TY79_9CUCU